MCYRKNRLYILSEDTNMVLHKSAKTTLAALVLFAVSGAQAVNVTQVLTIAGNSVVAFGGALLAKDSWDNWGNFGNKKNDKGEDEKNDKGELIKATGTVYEKFAQVCKFVAAVGAVAYGANGVVVAVTGDDLETEMEAAQNYIQAQ